MNVPNGYVHYPGAGYMQVCSAHAIMYGLDRNYVPHTRRDAHVSEDRHVLAGLTPQRRRAPINSADFHLHAYKGVPPCATSSKRSSRPMRSSRRSFPTRPLPPTSRSSRVSTRSTRTSPTSSLPRASTSARSMTSRPPRKCSTILPMPMRRRCSRWTSPKTRPSFPARGRH